MGVAQVAHDLLDEERVALGLAVQGVDERRLGLRHAERRHELGDLRLGQTAELDVAEQPFAAHVADQLVQRVAGLELGVAIGAEQQRAARLRRADEVPEQLQRRAVGPVQVVEDEHERRAVADLAEQCGHRVEEAQAAGVSVVAVRAGLVVLAARRAELAEQDREVGGADADALAQRLERRAGRPAADHLDHRLVRRERLLVEAAVEDVGAVVVGSLPDLGGEAGLADPGVAGQQDERMGAVDRLRPARLEHVELERAADQRVPFERRRERRRPRRDPEPLGAGGRRLRRGRLAAQHAIVDRHRGLAGRRAELVAQQDPQLLEHAQRLGGVALRLVHLHQQPVGRLAERRGGDRRPGGLLGGAQLAPALVQARLAERLEPAQADRLQLAPHLGHPRPVAVGQEGLQVDARSRRAARTAASVQSWPSIAASARAAAVAATSRSTSIGPPGTNRSSDAAREGAFAERLAQFGEQRAQRRVGRGGRSLGPQQVDQLGPAAVAIAVQDQVGEQQPPLAARHRRRHGPPIMFDAPSAHKAVSATPSVDALRRNPPPSVDPLPL